MDVEMEAAERDSKSPATGSARRSIRRRLAIVFSIHGLFIAALIGLHIWGSVPAVKLQGYDILALPGESVTLRAKLERDLPGPINPDIHGWRITFRARPKPGADPVAIGAADTGDDGIASIPWTAPQEPGIHRVDLGLSDPRRARVAGRRPSILVQVVPKDASIIVTDVDGTIGGESLTELFGEAKPLEDAARILKHLARDHRIVYISARDDALLSRTHDWLDYHGFPNGAVYCRDLALDTLSPGAYKTRLLAGLKEKWTRIAWGIGNTDADAAAYVENGIRAIIVGRTEAEEADRVTRVKDWTGVAKKILGFVPELEK
ncbi:MAG: hypothetical protein JXP34_21145 [Planctomycetes bacterium]|nr:hypothetical protein [Planctomycetota bacterium]